MEKEKSIENFVSSLQVLHNCNDLSHLGTVFETRNNLYFYDAGTGKVFCCDAEEYFLLNYLLIRSEENKGKILELESMKIEKAINNVIDLFQQQYILQMPLHKKFTEISDNELRDITKGNLNSITLELTEKCNLRCKYCIYHDDFSNFRNFDIKDMKFSTAKKAIDFAMNHSGRELTLAFYGGEPLLKFDLMKKCIDYAYAKYAISKDITISFTSNFTLMSEKYASYFAELPNCTITCSLDGSADQHDKYRVDAYGKGSFTKTETGLKIWIDKISRSDNFKLNSASIHTVLTPPYSEEQLKTIKTYLGSQKWLPSNIWATIGYVDMSGKDSGLSWKTIKENARKHYASKDMKETDPIKHWALRNLSEGNLSNHYEKILLRPTLVKTHYRNLSNTPIDTMAINGCCIPGERKLYVTVDGNFKICEKMGDSKFIGNVHEGLKLDVIRGYLDEYSKKSESKCDKCWAVHLCSMCYISCFDENGIDLKKKSLACYKMRSDSINNLIEYYQILEDNPVILEEFIEME